MLTRRHSWQLLLLGLVPLLQAPALAQDSTPVAGDEASDPLAPERGPSTSTVLQPLPPLVPQPAEIGRDLGAHVSLWLGLGGWSLTQDARGGDAAGTALHVALGLEARLADPTAFPLGAILAYEFGWSPSGYEEREIGGVEGESELRSSHHLVDVGLCGAFEVASNVVNLYPYAAYTYYRERIERHDFDPERGAPAGLDGFDSHERIRGHGVGAGLQLAARFGDFGGLDANVSYVYLLDVEVNRHPDPFGLEGLDTDGHLVRLSVGPWFSVVPGVFTIGVRIGAGVRYLRGERERVGPVRVVFPHTYVSSNSIACQLRLLF